MGMMMRRHREDARAHDAEEAVREALLEARLREEANRRIAEIKKAEEKKRSKKE